MTEWDQYYERSIDDMQAQLDQIREVYEYLRQTTPQAWAPIMIVEKLALILEDDISQPTVSSETLAEWPAPGMSQDGL